MGEYDEYPERRPAEISPLKFIFSPESAGVNAADLKLQVEAMERRIDDLVSKAEVKGVPIVAHILNLTHDVKTLEMVGEITKRVALLMPKLDELRRRKAIVDFAVKNPEEMAALVGDLESVVGDADSALANIVKRAAFTDDILTPED